MTRVADVADVPDVPAPADVADAPAPADAGHTVGGGPWPGARLLVGEATEVIGPLSVVVGTDGLRFGKAGGGGVRRLPWRSVQEVAVGPATPGSGRTAADGHPASASAHWSGAVLLVRTSQRSYRVELPATDVASVRAALRSVLPLPAPGPNRSAERSPVVAPTAGPLAPPAPAASAQPPATLRTAGAVGATLGPLPAARSASDERAAPAGVFERVRPVLAVALVLAVATMVALVLAASAGAIHLSWLGGPGPSSPTSTLSSG